MGGAMDAAAGPITSRERVTRDDDIVRLRAEGASWQEVSERTGVSTRQCRRIAAAYSGNRLSVASLDLIEWVESTYLTYEEAIDKLADIAETTNNPSAKIG